MIEAVYTPANGNFTGSTSPTATEVVNKGQPKVGISLPSTTAKPITAGESLTFTVTVSAGGDAFPVVFPCIFGLMPSGGTPATGLPNPVAQTGQVNFYDGTTLLNTTAPIALVNGTATFTTTTLPVGLNAISVQYLGNTNYLTGSSRKLYVHVGTSTTTTTTTTSKTDSTTGNTGSTTGCPGSTTGSGQTGGGATKVATTLLAAGRSVAAEAVATVLSKFDVFPKVQV